MAQQYLINCHIQGQIDLSGIGKRGYHIPKKGTVQVVSYNILPVRCLHTSLFSTFFVLSDSSQPK